MHCSDLERYLEACLDGQLGDSRRRALKDHLAFCGSCRERVDSLLQFEAELQRRLRSMQHEVSLWQPLGLETVPRNGPRNEPRNGPGTGPGAEPVRRVVPAGVPPGVPVIQPPLAAVDAAGGGLVARRRHRLRATAARGTPPMLFSGFGPGWGRRVQSIAGVALIAAAVGALADLALTGLGWLGADRRAAVYRAYVDGEVDLDLTTGEPARLSLWLAEQLGGPVSLPDAPGGVALVGGTAMDESAPVGAAMAVYATPDGPALLMIETMTDAAATAGDASSLVDGLGGAGEVVVEDGLSRLDWRDGLHAYSLIGALPPDKLALFAD